MKKPFGDYLMAQVQSGEANKTAQAAIEKSCADNARLGLKPTAMEMAIAEKRGIVASGHLQRSPQCLDAGLQHNSFAEE